jgi:hypothetical protein
MALPKAIQQQVETADELVAQISGDKTGELAANDPPETGTTNELPPDPPPAEPPEQTISQEPPAAKEVPGSKWENKYHTLKGMYDAEVPRLHAEMREMKAQMQQLMAEKAAVEAKAAKAPEPQRTLITEQDKEAFGPDLIDLIERATESKISDFREREEQLVSEIKQLKSQLGNVSERQVVSDKDRFLMSLTNKAPYWEQLNTDPGFLEWLQQVDPVYGLPRQVALQNAYEVFDADRVSTIFKTYYDATQPKQPQQQPRQELQRQVAPTRSRASTPPAADAGNQRIFNQQEIEQFYNDWRRGYIENDEAVRMEKEIHAAIQQGRIR